MFLIFYIMIALLSSFIGSISGIGGGIIIKPVLDLTGRLPIETVNFLSGATVLSMSLFSLIQYVIRATKKHDKQIGDSSKIHESKQEITLLVFLCIGSIIGGLIGSEIFSLFMQKFRNESIAVLIQAIIIMLITLFVIVYQYYKKKIKPYKFTGYISRFFAGLTLGLISSFLGIGGGPLNVAILAFCFSMSPKKAAINSLALVFSSQAMSLFAAILKNEIPLYQNEVLISMIISGIVGALIGRYISKFINDENTDKFFNITLILILAINIFNIIREFIKIINYYN